MRDVLEQDVSMMPDGPGSGSTLGRYRLTERLGETGFAEVFLARSAGVEGFEKQVVVKRLLPRLAADPEYLVAFEREARRAVRLAHANVVQVYDVMRVEEGDASAGIALAMEYVEGTDLAGVLEGLRARRAGGTASLPVRAVVHVAAEIAKALDHAHRRTDETGRPLGIVHRDISTRTVLLSWNGEVKVADFGFVRPTDARDDAAADRRALGALLEEMLQGIDVPSELARIVALAKTPTSEESPGAAGAIFEALFAFAQGSGERFGGAELAALLDPLRPIERPPPPSMRAAPAASPHVLATDVTALVLELSSAGRDGAASASEFVQGTLDWLRAQGACTTEVTDGAVVALYGLDGRHGGALAATRAATTWLRGRGPRHDDSAAVHGECVVPLDGETDAGKARIEAIVAVARELARRAPGRVVLSASAARRARSSFVLEPLFVGDDADAAFVVRAAASSEANRLPFVGRHTELRRIGALLASSERGEAQLIAIDGVAGVGKSRLLDEVARRLDRGRFPHLLGRWRCAPEDAATAWSGWRGLLRGLLDVEPDDDASRRDAAAMRLEALGLSPGDAAVLVAVLDGHAGTDRAPPASLLDTFEKLVAALGVMAPPTFVFDDAHNLDAATRDAIVELVSRESRVSAAFLFGGESGRTLPLDAATESLLAARSRLHRLSLADLTEEETAKLVAHAVGATALPPELLAHVRRVAGGHPLFVEELASALVVAGGVRIADGEARFRPEVAASVPSTLADLLATLEASAALSG